MTKIEVQLNTLREQVEKLKPVEGEEEKPITRAELHALGKSVQTILMVKRQILGMSAEDFAAEQARRKP